MTLWVALLGGFLSLAIVFVLGRVSEKMRPFFKEVLEILSVCGAIILGNYLFDPPTFWSILLAILFYAVHSLTYCWAFHIPLKELYQKGKKLPYCISLLLISYIIRFAFLILGL